MDSFRVKGVCGDRRIGERRGRDGLKNNLRCTEEHVRDPARKLHHRWRGEVSNERSEINCR